MYKHVLSAILMTSACAVASGQSVFSGQYSAELTNTATGGWVGDTALDVGNQMVAVTAGQNLRLKFLMKSANVGPSVSERVSIAFFSGVDSNGGGTGWLGDFSTAVGASMPRQWAEYTYDVTAPATAAYAAVSFRVAAGGNPSHSVQIDEVTLIDTAAPGTDLLAGRGSFENWSDPNAAPDGWRFFAVAGASGTLERLEKGPLSSVQATQLFKIDAGTSVSAGTFAWFNGDGTDGHTARGLAYNRHTNHLLVADRDATAGHTVHILDASNGAELGTFNTTGMTSGTFTLNKVAVDDAGRIFVTNLARNGQEFVVYSYPNEAAAQTTPPTIAHVFKTVSGQRFGDDLAVVGSGASTRIVSVGFQNDDVLYLIDPDNDGTFTASTAPLDVTGVGPGMGNIAFDPDATKYWYHQSGASAIQQDTEFLNYNADATPAAGPYPVHLGYATGPFDVKTFAGDKLVAVAPAQVNNSSLTSIPAHLYKVDGADLVHIGQTGGLQHAGGFLGNGNGVGDVAIDAQNGRVFVLFTNNSISAWELLREPSAASEWQLFE